MFIDLVDKVDNSPYFEKEPTYYTLLTHDDVKIGKMIPSVVSKLTNVDWLKIGTSTVKIIDPTNLDSKFADLTKDLRESKVFSCLEGWRNELYQCYTTNGKKYFDIERSAACLFGIVTYGCHITGYEPDSMKIWVPRRSYSKPTFPGMLDNTVAGGLGDGVGFHECVIKECEEEASLDAEYVSQNLMQAGVLTYEFIDPKTGYYQPEVECVYDLVFKDGVLPRPNDGEVHSFDLMDINEVKSRLLAGEFKYNSALVLIDFLMRRGLLTIENEPNYIEIVQRSHRKLEYPMRK